MGTSNEHQINQELYDGFLVLILVVASGYFLLLTSTNVMSLISLIHEIETAAPTVQ